MILSVRRTLFALLAIVLIHSAASAQTNVITFAQFVTGADYVTTVTLTNTNVATTVTGTLYIYNQDGTARSTIISGKGTATSFPLTIPPGGTTVVNTSLTGGIAVSGMAKFVSDYPADGVVQFAYGGGEVGVLATPLHINATLPINTANGNDTGFAIANPGSSAINLRLVQVDGSGNVVQSVDPPSLNPLAANAQIAIFVDQLGFNAISNLSTGSVQIQNKGTGKFSALGLLLKNAQLATTAVIDGVSGKLSPELMQGSYTGTWNNTTFGSSGSASLSEGVVTSTSTVLVQLTLTGNVFGGSSPAPTVLAGTYTSTGFTASGTSSLFGPMTMSVSATGTWTVTANSVPGGTVTSFSLTGTARPEGFSGNYTVQLAAGGAAAGTLVMNHTGR